MATPPTVQTVKMCPVLATTPPRAGGRDRRGTCDNSGWPAGARETLVEHASPFSSSKQESEDPGGPSGNAGREAPQSDPSWGVDNSYSAIPCSNCAGFTLNIAALLLLSPASERQQVLSYNEYCGKGASRCTELLASQLRFCS